MYIHEVLGAWHVIPPRVQVLREEELIAGGQDEELGHGEPLPVHWSQGHTPTQQSFTRSSLIPCLGLFMDNEIGFQRSPIFIYK